MMSHPRRVLCLAAALLLAGAGWSAFSQAPKIAGKITGGFQAPATQDPSGRRSVLTGTDAIPLENGIYEITAPRVTTFRPDDSPDMIIEAPHCRFDLRNNLAYSDSELFVRTADGKFSIQGEGWFLQRADSLLIISNNIVALVKKGAITAPAGGLPAGANTNETLRVTSSFFTFDGKTANFRGNVLVVDGSDRLTCDTLGIEFAEAGGVRRIEAIENVRLEQGETEVLSGRAVYDLAGNLITITENPRWISEARSGSASLLRLDRAEKRLTAEGEVYMKLPLTNTVGQAETPGAAATNFIEIRSDHFVFHEAPAPDTPASAVYEGNVRAEHPRGAIQCEVLNVHFIPGENRVGRIVAEREVQINIEANKAFGDKAVYDLDAEKITLSGNPRWDFDEKTGRSDLIVFYPETEELLALGHVEMRLPASAAAEMNLLGQPGQPREPASTNIIQISARTFSRQGDIAVFHENVRVADQQGTLSCPLVTVITGASNEVRRIIAEGGVVIEQEGLRAEGRQADYELAKGLITLSGDPVIQTPERTLSADLFEMDRNENTFAARGRYRITMTRESVKRREENQ